MNNEFLHLDPQSPNVKSMKFCRKFEFRGFGPTTSYCSILLLETKESQHVLICSQPTPPYKGTSITNAIESIAATSTLNGWMDWMSENHHWFEHYPIGAGLVPSRYSLMRVHWAKNGFSWGQNQSWEEVAKILHLKVTDLAYGFSNEIKSIQ